MRSLVICAALLCAPLAHADLIYRDSSVTLILTDAECTVPIAVAAVKDDFKDKQRQGSVAFSGRKLDLCWIKSEGAYWIMDENGAIKSIPVNFLKEGDQCA